LQPALRLVAGVGEQQGGDRWIQGRQQAFVHVQAEVASPRKAIDALGQQAAQLRDATNRARENQRIRCRHAHRRPCGFLRVADRGAHRPGAQLGPQSPQPAEAQLALYAALAADQLMPFIENHRLELGEKSGGGAVGKQQ
jgi:hypothetical protein